MVRFSVSVLALVLLWFYMVWYIGTGSNWSSQFSTYSGNKAMKNSRIFVLSGLSLFITGCIGNSANKVADLGGLVFLLFIAFTVSKYIGPRIFSLPIFSQLRDFISRIGTKAFLISLPMAVALVTYGFMNSTLDRLLALIGLSLVVLSFHLKDLDNDDLIVRARAFDVVGMGSVITVVLVALWVMGADLFRL
jgi:hypothetical protein